MQYNILEFQRRFLYYLTFPFSVTYLLTDLVTLNILEKYKQNNGIYLNKTSTVALFVPHIEFCLIKRENYI